jgi:CBS domain-containing protein
MHHGIFGCDPEAPLAEVATIMANHRVHAIAVHADGSRPRGIISDLDVIAAVASANELCAADIAATEALTISSEASLREAARLMTEHGVSHLVALNRANGHAVGILSTVDIVSVYARAVSAQVTK